MTKEIELKGTPSELIVQAVQGGADLDKLKGLLELQERWEANQARKAFHVAMSEFKSNPIEIEKNRTVGYDSSKGGKVGYKHASLDNIVRTVTKALSKHGLSSSWRTDQSMEGKISVTCKITHILGHSEETTLSAQADTSGSKNSIQAIGSTISYLQRYSILAVLGLATSDMDDDGHSSEPVIEDKQLHTLRDLLIAKELSESGLVKIMKVEKLEDLKASDYAKALNAINSAKKPQVK